jgi:para-nitrobenzyl esterase
MGLKDQVMALQWIQENIRKFAGDPNRVTLFGAGDGASAVQLLMLSPSTKGTS